MPRLIEKLQLIDAHGVDSRLVTQDAGMARVLETARQIAPNDCNELFGHSKGAYAGATETTGGLIEAASG